MSMAGRAYRALAAAPRLRKSTSSAAAPTTVLIVRNKQGPGFHPGPYLHALHSNTLFDCSTLVQETEEENSGGHRHVQRFFRALHRNSGNHVALCQNFHWNSLNFVTDDHRCRSGD